MARPFDSIAFDARSHQATRLEAIGGRYDPWLIGAAVALAALGVVMVASSSVAIGRTPFEYLTRHLVFLGAGVAACVLVARIELKTIENYNQLLLLGCFVLLLVVFIPGLGHEVKGAQRWVRLGSTTFQPVEMMKLMFIVWLASYLVRFRDEVNTTWGAMLKPVGVALGLVVLLLVQPDFGSATMLLAVTAGMLLLGGGHLWKMLLPVVLLVPALVGLAWVEPYRLRRITSFWNPWEDPFGAGYQLSNALMAIGRGELGGVGFGASIQKLSYLPEAHTDFIFAVIAEELGFVGVCLVIGLFCLLVGRGLWIGYQCVLVRRHFAGYIAFGVVLMLGLQALVSMGVNLGVLPTKGLTLPLISYGGSSVVMTCAAIGLLLRVSYEMDRTGRMVRRLRGEAGSANADEAADPVPAPVSRGSSSLRQRIEPGFGGAA